MLTGAVPFDGDTPVAIAMRHLDEPVPLPSSRVADLPANLDEVVIRATAKAPTDRYPDADAMAMALARRESGADAATRALPAGEATSVLAVGASTAMMPALGATSATPSQAAGTTSRLAATGPDALDRPDARGRRTAVTPGGRSDGRRRGGPGALVWVLVAVVLALVATLGYVVLVGHRSRHPGRLGHQAVGQQACDSFSHHHRRPW